MAISEEDKLLHCVAAHASQWIYNAEDHSNAPDYGLNRYMPKLLTFSDESAQFYRMSYQMRVMIPQAGLEQSHKATFVANVTDAQGKEITILVLVFCGTKTVMDILANSGVTMNEERFADIGLSVHACWHALVANPHRLGEMLSRIQEERPQKVLICGHSLGGALAQIATLIAYDKKVVDEPTIKVKCVAFASPMPFATVPEGKFKFPRPKRDRLKEEQQQALKFLEENCVVYINNNDLVPRCPGLPKYICERLKKCGKFYVSATHIPGFDVMDIRPAMLVNHLEGKTQILETYNHTACLKFVGHKKIGDTSAPLLPNGLKCKTELKDIKGPCPKTEQYQGLANYWSGQLRVAIADHVMGTYLDSLYTSLGMLAIGEHEGDLQYWHNFHFLTVPKLEGMCKAAGLPFKGAKAELKKRLVENHKAIEGLTLRDLYANEPVQRVRKRRKVK